MLRTVVFAVAALASAPALSEECVYKAKSGAELWFADPVTLVVKDHGSEESCRLLSAGTGIVLSRGVGCRDGDVVPLVFDSEEMNTVRFRDVDWFWTCEGN